MSVRRLKQSNCTSDVSDLNLFLDALLPRIVMGVRLAVGQITLHCEPETEAHRFRCGLTQHE